MMVETTTVICSHSGELNIYMRIIKKTFGIVCMDIKTEKAQEKDWDGTLAIKLN